MDQRLRLAIASKAVLSSLIRVLDTRALPPVLYCAVLCRRSVVGGGAAGLSIPCSRAKWASLHHKLDPFVTRCHRESERERERGEKKKQ